MDLGVIETALTSWVETSSGLELEWGRQPQLIHKGPFVLGYLGPITKTGHDERIQTFNSGPDTTSVRVVGVRTLPLRLSFRSFDQRLGGSARHFAETFRADIHTDTALEVLRDAELALMDTEELVESDYAWSGRQVSQVDMSLTIGTRASFSDTLHDGSYIGTVNATSQQYVVDEFGNPVLDESGAHVIDEAGDTFAIPEA